jgi:hypothetical protein
MDFVRGKETHSEPVDSSLKHSPESLTNSKKRSISPEIKHVHNSEDHQNKRKKILIKRALLKSFISSVNTKINLKNPSLPITIPTHLFINQSLSDSTKQDITSEDQSIERSQRTSKRYSNGLLKHDINTDVIDSLSQLSSSSSLNNQTTTHQKKNKTSHVTLPSTTIPKNEQTIISTNETDSKIRTTTLTATVIPIITSQPKKEKPTAK